MQITENLLLTETKAKAFTVTHRPCNSKQTHKILMRTRKGRRRRNESERNYLVWRIKIQPVLCFCHMCYTAWCCCCCCYGFLHFKLMILFFYRPPVLLWPVCNSNFMVIDTADRREWEINLFIYKQQICFKGSMCSGLRLSIVIRHCCCLLFFYCL